MERNERLSCGITAMLDAALMQPSGSHEWHSAAFTANCLISQTSPARSTAGTDQPSPSHRKQWGNHIKDLAGLPAGWTRCDTLSPWWPSVRPSVRVACPRACPTVWPPAGSDDGTMGGAFRAAPRRRPTARCGAFVGTFSPRTAAAACVRFGPWGNTRSGRVRAPFLLIKQQQTKINKTPVVSERLCGFRRWPFSPNVASRSAPSL